MGFEFLKVRGEPNNAGTTLHQAIDPWNVAIVFVIGNTTANGILLRDQDCPNRINMGFPIATFLRH
jgi:hypothetical protein